MKLSSFIRIGFATAALALVVGVMPAGSALGQTATPAAAPRGIAVVNLVQLFNALEQKRADDADLANMSNKMQDDIRKRREELTTLDNQLNGPQAMFKPDTPDFKAQQEVLLQKSADLDSYMKVSQTKLFLEQRLRTEALYRKINDAVKQYSEKNGIALVFVSDDVDFRGARDVRELQAQISVRKLLYVHPSYDITVQVKNMMNDSYALQGK